MNLDTALKIVPLVLQAAIPLAIFFAGRRIARAQYTKAMQDAWNDFNKLAISDQSNIEVIQEFFGPPLAKASEKSCRKAYLGFVMLNTSFAFWYGARHGLLDSMYQREEMDEILGSLLQDGHLFELSQTRGYHPKFKKHCKEIRDGHMAHVENRYKEHCECRHGCPTYAEVTEWNCGCIEVEIFRDGTAGSDCTDFSGMRRRCGKPGRPGD